MVARVNIVEPFTFKIGRYTVQQRPRFDSPGWAQYVVYLGDLVIGKSFSMPDEGCCDWLYAQQRDQTFYAYSSAPIKTLSVTSSAGRTARYLNRKRRG